MLSSNFYFSVIKTKISPCLIICNSKLHQAISVTLLPKPRYFMISIFLVLVYFPLSNR